MAGAMAVIGSSPPRILGINHDYTNLLVVPGSLFYANRPQLKRGELAAAAAAATEKGYLRFAHFNGLVNENNVWSDFETSVISRQLPWCCIRCSQTAFYYWIRYHRLNI